MLLVSVLFVVWAQCFIPTAANKFARVADKKLWEQQACPAEMAVYNCYFQGMGSHAEHLDTWQHPEGTRHDPVHFLERIGERSVLFYGDSIMLQTFVGTVCNIYGTEGVTAEFNLTWNYRDWLGQLNCPYGSKHCELMSSSCVLFNGHTRMCFEWHDGVNEPSPTKLHDRLRLHGMNNNDIVVGSIGTWFFQSTDIAGETAKFTTAVKAIQNEVQLLKMEQNFYYVENSPQHFGNQRQLQGYYFKDLSSQYSVGADAYLRSGFKTPNPCVALANKTLAYETDVRNRVPQKVFGDSVHFIRTWSHLADLHWAHVTTPRRPGRSFVLDCSHWCMPGPLVHIFAKGFAKAFVPFKLEHPVPY